MTDRNPLAPLERILAVIGVPMILVLLVIVPASLLGSGDQVFGFGGSVVCVDAPYDALLSDTGHGVSNVHVRDVAPGVHANPSQFDLCANEPSTRQRMLSTLIELPQFLFGLGFVVIAWRLTRRVRKRGLFLPEVAAAIGRLSVFLFFGDFAVAITQALAHQALVSTMVTGSHRNDSLGLMYAAFSWVVLIAAFGLQAMSRVMALTVPMQDEIDATV